MNQKPAVSFIICTYNRANYLDDTLQSLLAHNYPESDFEIIVVDNNSTDQTQAVVEKHQNRLEQDNIGIRYLKECMQGLSYARNRGIREAEADCLVFFDDDIRASESLIPAWLRFFEQWSEMAAAGGKIHVQFDAPRPRWMSHFLLPLLGYHDLGKEQKEYPSNKYPFGGNMGFVKSLFDEAGLFDTDLGRKGKELNGGEEKELFNRISRLSIPIYYLPEAYLYHRVDSSRLSIDYIRKQAMGLGKTIALQLRDSGVSLKLKITLEQLFKFTASLVLFVVYTLGMQLSKAVTLIKFRWWILLGYLNHKQ